MDEGLGFRREGLAGLGALGLLWEDEGFHVQFRVLSGFVKAAYGAFGSSLGTLRVWGFRGLGFRGLGFRV